MNLSISGKQTLGRLSAPGLALWEREKMYHLQNPPRKGVSVEWCIHTQGLRKPPDAQQGRLVKVFLTQSQPVINSRGGDASSMQSQQHETPRNTESHGNATPQ